MTVEKPKPKQLLRPITTGAGSAMNQSQFLAITCNSLEARERSPVHGAIGFGLASYWSKNWRESFKPITKRSNRNHGITFDSHLKTALSYHGGNLSQINSFDTKFFTSPLTQQTTVSSETKSFICLLFTGCEQLETTCRKLRCQASRLQPTAILTETRLDGHQNYQDGN